MQVAVTSKCRSHSSTSCLGLEEEEVVRCMQQSEDNCVQMLVRSAQCAGRASWHLLPLQLSKSSSSSAMTAAEADATAARGPLELWSVTSLKSCSLTRFNMEAASGIVEDGVSRYNRPRATCDGRGSINLAKAAALDEDQRREQVEGAGSRFCGGFWWRMI